MDAIDVKPKDWNEIKILYNDGEYSIICGNYRNTSTLASRWNYTVDPDNIGFPQSYGKPAWYIEPDFLISTILQRLLTMYICKEKDHLSVNYVNLMFAIEKLQL